MWLPPENQLPLAEQAPQCLGRRQASALRALPTLRADAEELEFVIEILEARFATDLLFQFMHRARRLHRFDAAAFGADQVILMPPRNEQGEIRGALM